MKSLGQTAKETKTMETKHHRIERDEFILDCEWARIEEVKRLEKNNEPMLRVYRNAPESLNIQIRTFDGIGEWNKGAKRNMIATVPISYKTVEALIAYLQEVVAANERSYHCDTRSSHTG